MFNKSCLAFVLLAIFSATWAAQDEVVDMDPTNEATEEQTVGDHVDNALDTISNFASAAGQKISGAAETAWLKTKGAAASAGEFLSGIPTAAASSYESAKVFFTEKATQADQMWSETNTVEELKKLLAMVKAFLLGVKERVSNDEVALHNATSQQRESLSKIDEKIQLVDTTNEHLTDEMPAEERREEMQAFSVQLFEGNFMADLKDLSLLPNNRSAIDY